MANRIRWTLCPDCGAKKGFDLHSGRCKACSFETEVLECEGLDGLCESFGLVPKGGGTLAFRVVADDEGKTTRYLVCDRCRDFAQRYSPDEWELIPQSPRR